MGITSRHAATAVRSPHAQTPIRLHREAVHQRLHGPTKVILHREAVRHLLRDPTKVIPHRAAVLRLLPGLTKAILPHVVHPPAREAEVPHRQEVLHQVPAEVPAVVLQEEEITVLPAVDAGNQS